jgi:hypothetical protein
MDELTNATFPCPCCGHVVFAEAPGSYDICPACGWEDDLVQLHRPDDAGGANRPSLIEAQRNYRQTGASDPRLVAKARPPGTIGPIDPHWRPFDPARDGPTDQNDAAGPYYWRT